MSDLTATSTSSSTITLTWTEPDPIPSNGYRATRQCHRLCQDSFNNAVTRTSSSSPLVFSGINPGSTCTFSLFTGLYGTDTIEFDSGIIGFTLSAGELKNDIILDMFHTARRGRGCQTKFISTCKNISATWLLGPQKQP